MTTQAYLYRLGDLLQMPSPDFFTDEGVPQWLGTVTDKGFIPDEPRVSAQPERDNQMD